MWVLRGSAVGLVFALGCGPQVVSVQDQMQQAAQAPASAPDPVGLTPEEATRQVPTLRPLPDRRRVRPPAYQAPAAAPDPDPGAAFAGPPPAPKSAADDGYVPDEYAPD